jgi:hypothetical protein
VRTAIPEAEIIVYAEKHLRMRLDSLLAQTYSDFESIIWDDVSGDDGCKISAATMSPDKVCANAQSCADFASG